MSSSQSLFSLHFPFHVINYFLTIYIPLVVFLINTLILFLYIYVELQLLFDRVYIVVPGGQEHIPDGLQAITYVCVLAGCGHGVL